MEPGTEAPAPPSSGPGPTTDAPRPRRGRGARQRRPPIEEHAVHRPLVLKPIAACLIPLLLLLGAAELLRNQAEQPVGFAPPAGARTTGDLALIVLRDRSGSMSSVDNGVAKEVDATIAWFAQHGHPADQLAVIDFASDARERIPLGRAAAIAGGAADQLALPGGDVGGGTVFESAATTGRRTIDALPAGTSPMVVFVTDGQAKPEDVAKIRPILGDSTPIHVIGVGSWPGAASEWDSSVKPRRTWTVDRPFPGSFARPMAELLSALTGQTVTTA